MSLGQVVPDVTPQGDVPLKVADLFFKLVVGFSACFEQRLDGGDPDLPAITADVVVDGTQV